MTDPSYDGSHIVTHLENILKRRNGKAPAPVTVLLGSSRRAGNTARLVEAAFRDMPARIVDLSDHDVAPYDYGNRHAADDFLPLARNMAKSGAIVFATPVYWYAMSAQLKTFFDRLSDLTRVEKSLGRSLAGKTVFLIASSSSDALPDGFETPFAETARYLGMNWGGAFHARMDDGAPLPAPVEAEAAAFARKVAQSLKARAA